MSASAEGPDWLTPRLGGAANAIIATENAYAQPVSTLATAELRKFTFGNRVFNTNWVAAPASVEAFDGLGPVFNRVSCSSCHTRDGRGQPPTAPTESLDSMLIRISMPGRGEHGGVIPVPHYGDQLNEKALPGIPAEARTVVSYRERQGTYPDGTPYRLAVPRYEFAELGFGAMPAEVLYSPRVAPPVFGLGLLEAIPEENILAVADPDDSNGDGISGRPNRVWDETAGKLVLGRFGWKANQPNLRQQNAAAAIGDIGITTRLFPRENVAEGQDAAAKAPSGGKDGEPEMKDDFFEKLTFYTQTLAVPAARNIDDPKVREGAQLFAQAQCAACHTPTMTTADYPIVATYSWQVIHPFTDLLLHDMGDNLADRRPDYEASGKEWRTPPLWGIGPTSTVNRHTRFLHDGRARSMEEAILWHGGEAATARERFMRLKKAEREALLTFLQNL